VIGKWADGSEVAPVDSKDRIRAELCGESDVDSAGEADIEAAVPLEHHARSRKMWADLWIGVQGGSAKGR